MMNKRLLQIISVLTIGLVSTFSDAFILFAQESVTEEFTLEEITVTAEKREMNVQKTPIQISAVSGEDISKNSITDIGKALGNLAGVNVMAGSQGAKVFIRGIGSSLDTNEANPSVSVQQDNVYLGMSEAVATGLFDVDRVEVLFGPQGTMYGKNSAGGVVNVITKTPSLDELGGDASLTIGKYNLFNWETSLNIPIAENFAARVAVQQQKHDGYISDGSASADKLAARVRLLYEPTENISILWTSFSSYDDSIQGNSVPVAGSAGNLGKGMGNFVVPDVNGDGVADDFLDADGNRVDGGNGIPDIVDTGWLVPYNGDAWTNDEWHPAPKSYNRFKAHSLEVNWDLGFTKLTLIPTFQENLRSMNSDFITGISQGSDQMNNQSQYEEKQYTGELRFANGDNSKLIWTVGAYIYKSDNKQTSVVYEDLMDSATDTWLNGVTGGPPDEQVAAYTSDAAQTALYRVPQDSWSAFAQATYPVTDRFRITGGVRKNNDNNNMKYRIIVYDVTEDGIYGTDNSVDGYITNLYDQTTAVEDDTAEGGVRHLYDTGIVKYTVKSSPFTYKAGLEFDVDPDKMIYAYYTTGYKSGGLNIQGTVPPTAFDPEEVKAYTIGSKNRFLANRMQVNAEAYYYDYTGYQVFVRTDVYDPITDSTIGAMNVINAKDGTNAGIDLSMDYLISQSDRIAASVSYMDTEFGELYIPANGLAGIDGYDVTGENLPNAPEWSGTITYEHVFNLRNGAILTPRWQTKISAGYWANHEIELPGAWQDSYHMSDFYLTYASAGGEYSVTLWAKNIENAVVTNYVWPKYRRTIMDPRTTGITFSVKF